MSQHHYVDFSGKIPNANIDAGAYEAMYHQSIENPDTFWAEQAQRLDWIKPFTHVKNTSFGSSETSDVHVKWFEDGILNACYNCVDRHLPTKAEQTALIFEGDAPEDSFHVTYQELYDHVCRFANVLKQQGVQKGDRVTIYMPMIVEATYAMLACARIGAIHSVVFGGFSPEALAGRVLDCDSHFIITSNEGIRGGKAIPLKYNVDQAVDKIIAMGGHVQKVLVVKRTDSEVPMNQPHDIWYHEAVQQVTTNCPPEPMNAEDPLFILYTSGSTGKPKGVLHTTGGYLVWVSLSHHYIFDHKEDDIFWCTADVGWVTGHSYIVYGPLSNGACTVIFEGIPTYPDASRFWQVIEKHQVTVFYTAPTAIRSLMRLGDDPVKKFDRSSLRLLGSVGEPINPEAWHWYFACVGDSRCPIIDTWWQTETGGVMIAPIPSVMPLKAGSATRPFFGIQPVLLDSQGNLLTGAASGNLAIKDSWPGQMRTVYGDHQRFIDTYFSTYKGYYFTGDGCRRDEDGYYWITGRVDDVINVSGHRLGTAEIESALVAHNAVSEAAVVGYPHDIKGQGLYAYVTLKENLTGSDQLESQLNQWVRKEIGPIAHLDKLQFAPNLPKTRSGKIMRRILRKIAENQLDSLGDTSTLADPSVIAELIENRQS